MSLIKCPECGKEISNQAKCCPNCGYQSQKKQSPWIIVIAIACTIIGIVVIICGVSDFLHASKSENTITNTNETNNVLLDNYYLGSINNVYVLKFCSNNVLELVDCGWGRSTDTRSKAYGTYEINGDTVTIIINGTDEIKCVITDNGETINIGDTKFSKTNPEELTDSTLNCFD